MRFPFLLPAAGFFTAYLLFDWITYVEPLLGLNITPWNPDTALGLVFWLVYGRRAALPWFAALVAGDVLVRGVPGGLAGTLLTAAWLTCGYGLLGEILRRALGGGTIFSSRTSFYRWLMIVAAGTMLNAVGHISLLAWLGLVPWADWLRAVWRFGFGDMVGVVVSMPLLWKLVNPQDRARLREATWKPETVGYLALAIFVLWAVFGYIMTAEFKHFYFLFLPLIWAASRQGVHGAALVVFVLQLAIVALVRANHADNITVSELQMLDAVLALVGFFIGIVVDERRQVAEELKQTLRLAAAGEMAAALAHELNQPMTALAVYGKACEHLLARGDAGELLKNAIGQMINESARAAKWCGACATSSAPAPCSWSRSPPLPCRPASCSNSGRSSPNTGWWSASPKHRRWRCRSIACRWNWCCATCWPMPWMRCACVLPGSAASASRRKISAASCASRWKTAATA